MYEGISAEELCSRVHLIASNRGGSFMSNMNAVARGLIDAMNSADLENQRYLINLINRVDEYDLLEVMRWVYNYTPQEYSSAILCMWLMGIPFEKIETVKWFSEPTEASESM